MYSLEQILALAGENIEELDWEGKFSMWECYRSSSPEEIERIKDSLMVLASQGFIEPVDTKYIYQKNTKGTTAMRHKWGVRGNRLRVTQEGFRSLNPHKESLGPVSLGRNSFQGICSRPFLFGEEDIEDIFDNIPEIPYLDTLLKDDMEVA